MQEAVRITLQDELSEEEIEEVRSVVATYQFDSIKKALEAQRTLLRRIEEWGTGQTGTPIAGTAAVELRELLEEAVKARRWEAYGAQKALFVACRDQAMREALSLFSSKSATDGSLNYAGFDEIKASYLVRRGHGYYTRFEKDRRAEAVITRCNTHMKWLETDFIEIQRMVLAARDNYPEVFSRKMAGSSDGSWRFQDVMDVVVPRNRDLFLSREELNDEARVEYVAKHGGITPEVLMWAEQRVPQHFEVHWVDEPAYPFPGEELPAGFETYGLDRSVYEE